jgi:hypothetical protein
MRKGHLPLPKSSGFPSPEKFLAMISAMLLTSVGCNFVSSLFGTQPGGQTAPAAKFSYPQPSLVGITTANPFVPFSWQPVSAATAYSLAVGTAPGLEDVFAEGEFPPSVTSWPVGNLLPGSYFARLYTKSAAGWGHSDVRFLVQSQPVPSDQSAFYKTIEQLTASVRMSADGPTDTAIPGTPLAAELALRQRSTANCVDFAYTLNGLLQQKSIYSRAVNITLDGTSFESHTTVEYYDPFWQKWSIADPTFGVVYFDSNANRGQGAAELNQYVFTQSWDQIKPLFVTPNGDSYMRNYYMDPITLYLNLVPTGGAGQDSVVHDPTEFLIPYQSTSANPSGTYLFGFGDDTESLVLDNPLGPLITVDPDDTTVWSQAYSLNDNWSIVSGPADAQAYIFRRVLF